MAFDRAYLYLTAADSNGNIGGKYKRLSFSYSEIPGGSDETGHAIGPVRTVAITARGYWGDFPSKLDIEGIVFTMYDARTNLSAQVVENVRTHVEQRIYNTLIPRNIRLAEAPSYGEPITVYEPKSAGAEAYKKLAKEMLGQ